MQARSDQGCVCICVYECAHPHTCCVCVVVRKRGQRGEVERNVGRNMEQERTHRWPVMEG